MGDSFTLQVSVKLILADNNVHKRENTFRIKLQMCDNLRVTQQEWHTALHKV